VFEVVEPPLTRHLAEKGRISGVGSDISQHIGNAMLVRHRVSGRVAVTEKTRTWCGIGPTSSGPLARLEDRVHELKEAPRP